MKPFAGLLILAMMLSTTGCQLVAVPIAVTYSVEKALDVGTAALPYYAYSDVSLQTLNQRMQEANTTVTISETYEMAYGKLFSKVLPDGETGQVIGNIKDATEYFQRILSGNGIKNSGHYYLTSIPAPEDGSFTLFAAVYRPYAFIEVYDKHNPSEKRTLSQTDMKFYIPYEQDADGEELDTVYEWFALSTDCYANQRHQAILLTLAANEVIKQKPRPYYWTAEKKWLFGDYMEVLTAQDEAVCRAVGVESGFTIRK